MGSVAKYVPVILFAAVLVSCGGGGGGDGDAPKTVYVIVGDFPNQALHRFTVDAPDTVTSIGSITGQGSTIFWALVFRPADGELYAFGYNCTLQPPPWGIALYRIDVTTAAATLVNATATNMSCQRQSGFAVETSGVGRLVNANEHWSLDLDTGAFSSLQLLAYIAGDPNQGNTPDPEHLARDDGGQAYVIDSDNEVLARLADLANPDPGRLSTVGSLGAFLAGTDLQKGGGFDISGSQAFAILRTTASGLDRLYGIDLNTGEATDLGLVGDGLLEIDAMAIMP